MYGDLNEVFSLWNGATVRAITRREEGDRFLNFSEKLEAPVYPHKLSEVEYRELPEEIRREHATFLMTEFLKDSTMRRK